MHNLMFHPEPTEASSKNNLYVGVAEQLKGDSVTKDSNEQQPKSQN